MAVALNQFSYRFRTDATAAQGGTPVWGAAQSITYIPPVNTPFRIRFCIESTGSTSPSSFAYTLYVSKNGGAYAAVPSTSSGNAIYQTDATAGASANESSITSALLTGATGTFLNGYYVDSGGTTSFVLTHGDYTEIEFGLEINGSVAVTGDNYQFLVYSGTTPLTTYTQTPAFTLGAGSISLIGTNTASATTVTIPAHQAGDLIIIFAVHGGATTIPTLGTGFTSILTKSGTSIGSRLGYRWATSTSDTSGTWTNANIIDCHVYRASSGNVMGIGSSKSSSSTSLTVNFPALTLSDGYSGNTWVAGFVGVNNATQVCTVAPLSMINESTLVGTYSIAGFDTNGGVTNWPSTNATDTGTVGDSVSYTVELNLMPGAPQPTQVVQHIGGGSSPPGQSLAGNAYKIPLANSSGTGNCLVLGVSYDHALTVTVSDNVNGTWGAAVTYANAGTGNTDSAVYVFPNSASGVTTITVSFNTTSNAFQYAFTEFSGIDNSPSAGSTNTAFIAGPSCGAGSFTPTNNDSTGGNLIWLYVAESQPSASTICTNIRAGQRMTLLDADIGWASSGSACLFHASASYVQTANAAINPTISMINCTDQFNSCAVALKLNSTNGTARHSGINLIRICHFSTYVYPAASASAKYVIQTPVVGNLRVLACDDPNISSSTVVTDNEGGTFTAASTTGIFYRANTTSNSDLCITITGGGGDARLSWRIYDVIGAATSPFDNANVTDDDPVGTTWTQTNSPTPTTGNGIVIANVGLGTGPGKSITSPSGAIFDLCTYTGETDLDIIEDADLSAHYYYSSNTAETWTWTCSVSSSASGGYAIFAAAPSGTSITANCGFIAEKLFNPLVAEFAHQESTTSILRKHVSGTESALSISGHIIGDSESVFGNKTSSATQVELSNSIIGNCAPLAELQTGAVILALSAALQAELLTSQKSYQSALAEASTSLLRNQSLSSEIITEILAPKVQQAEASSSLIRQSAILDEILRGISSNSGVRMKML